MIVCFFSLCVLFFRPQVAMATAQVLFQRFFYVASLKDYGIVVSCLMLQNLHLFFNLFILKKEIGMGALFLSSKLEECIVRMTHLITVYDMLIRRARKESTEIPLDAFSQVLYSKQLIFSANHILTVSFFFFFLARIQLQKHGNYSRNADFAKTWIPRSCTAALQLDDQLFEDFGA